MLNDTLRDGLEKYRIGAKIRGLRSAKGLGLAQLGDHTGLSAGMLSKIERGTVFPTLPTLLRISLVFGVGLDHFFADGEVPVLEVIRKKDRIKLPDTTDRSPAFMFESLDFPVNDRPNHAFLAEFQPRARPTDAHEHEGVEFIYLISGKIKVDVHNEEHDLDAGDSMYFDARYPHSYQGRGDGKSQALVVVTQSVE